MDNIKYLQEFANKHKIVFEDQGECGFGRECIGLRHGDGWIDHNPINMTTYDPIPEAECEIVRETSPDNAYHKHDCLAVTGRGEGTIAQLAGWIRALEAAGEVSIIDYATGATGLQATLTGLVGCAIIVRKP